jgi:hypothetical protein
VIDPDERFVQTVAGLAWWVLACLWAGFVAGYLCGRLDWRESRNRV